VHQELLLRFEPAALAERPFTVTYVCPLKSSTGPAAPASTRPAGGPPSCVQTYNEPAAESQNHSPGESSRFSLPKTKKCYSRRGMSWLMAFMGWMKLSVPDTLSCELIWRV